VLNELPDAVLVLVGELLCHRDMVRALPCCKRWLEALPRAVRHLDTLAWGGLTSSVSSRFTMPLALFHEQTERLVVGIQQITHNAHGEELDGFHFSSEHAMVALSHAAEHCTRLRELDANSLCSWAINPFLQLLVSRCGDTLCRISLANSLVDHSTVCAIARHCKTSLKDLDITSVAGGLLTDDSLCRLAEHCLGLEQLEFSWSGFSVAAVATLLRVCRLERYQPDTSDGPDSCSDAVYEALARSPLERAEVDAWCTGAGLEHLLRGCRGTLWALRWGAKGVDQGAVATDVPLLETVAAHGQMLEELDFGDNEGECEGYCLVDPGGPLQRANALLFDGWCLVARKCSQLRNVNLGICDIDASTLFCMGREFARHGQLHTLQMSFADPTINIHAMCQLLTICAGGRTPLEAGGLHCTRGPDRRNMFDKDAYAMVEACVRAGLSLLTATNCAHRQNEKCNQTWRGLFRDQLLEGAPRHSLRCRCSECDRRSWFWKLFGRRGWFIIPSGSIPGF
jgi:hypothetical protein